MKQIFKGEVYEILPLKDGVIFSYCREIVDENVVVAFKMISFETGRITDMAKNIYMITKFGSNYRAVSAHFENYITVKSLLLSNGKVFFLETDGTAALINNDGTTDWQSELKYRTTAPSDILLCKDAIWASYSDCNVVLKYNLTTMREELRIGGNQSPFDKPRDLFADGDDIFISNYGSQKIIRLNLNNYSVCDYKTFEEPIYQYVKVANNEFVILQSGLYLI